MKIALAIVAVLCLLIIPFSSTTVLDIALAVISVVCIGLVILWNRANQLPYLMILAAAPLIPLTKWLEPAIANQTTEAAYQALENELDIAESTISQFFQNNASALDSVSVLASQQLDITNDRYQRWLNQILPAYRNQFLNVALSRDLVVVHVYPENDANLRVLGVNLGDVPNQGLLYKSADATRQRLVIGPVQLLQGEPGLIYVRPVPDSNDLIVSGVLSLTTLKTELESMIDPVTAMSITVSTAAMSHMLMDHNKQGLSLSRKRNLRFDEITVEMSASSSLVNQLDRRAKTIARFSAVAFWAAIVFILSWQHLNFRIREQQRQALKESEAEFIAAQRLGQMGSWSSSNMRVLKLSEPLQDLLQLDSELLSVAEFFSLLHPESEEQLRQQISAFIESDKENLIIEHQLMTGDHYRWFEHRIARNDQESMTGILKDIHTLRKRDEQVAQLESFDSLTGVANRHYFKHLTTQNIALCDRRRSTLALVLINIDDFRSINEKHGQLCGDQLLQQVSNRLQRNSRKSDLVARLSGDTFAVALVDIGKNRQSVLVIEQLLRRLKEPYHLSNELYPQFTLGVAMFPDDGKDYDALLRMTEAALSSAKSHARGGYRYYSAELSEQTDRRQRVLAGLPGAIANDYLSLVFQPRVDSSRDNAVTSMEALVRWNDPDLGFVSPGEFIPIAEQTSLIADIGYWVMEHAFKLTAQHQTMLPKDLTISINLSPRQLEDRTLLASVEQLLSKYDVSANQFELEITEYSISEESESILQNMRELSKMGFKFALDDFGTGYSNLGILQSLPLNVLKVDMSFIRAIGSSDKSDELVRAILNMGHTLGLKVVAEGVETIEQVHFLQQLSCEELQGYYFYKPEPLDVLINRWQSAASVDADAS